MSLRSSIVTLLFVLTGTILVCAYACFCQTPDGRSVIEAHTHLPTDVLAAIIIALLALVCGTLGGNGPIIAITSTLGIFVALTAYQSAPIRYMTLAAVLFCIGFYGMVVSRNAVRVLISIELMLNAVNINFVTLSRFVDPAGIKGQIFAIFILTVAAAEAAVGLAIVLALYRNNSTVDMDNFSKLRG